VQATDTLDLTIADRGTRRLSTRCFAVPTMFAAALARGTRASVRLPDRAKADA
jgi:hypothetical protein